MNGYSNLSLSSLARAIQTRRQLETAFYPLSHIPRCRALYTFAEKSFPHWQNPQPFCSRLQTSFSTRSRVGWTIRFVIPGTRIRFGLDALIGWIPGLGDAVAAAASLLIIVAAWKRGVARITMVRMLLNLTVENMLGAIPIIGDFCPKCGRLYGSACDS
jgi:hypothetical protein